MSQSRKPRVFLSHSKKDIDFIRRLEKDLRNCLCETWFDEIEIRHGKSWLDEVFSTGIPSCEILLCYITENSINSSVVRQELDARLLERLQTDRVALLIYTDSEASRSKLRIDIQRLHAPILNQENYGTMLPRVIAEIWRSYAEYYAASAAQSEKIKRLEAEIRVKELEELKPLGMFSSTEDIEFSIIWKKMCRGLNLKLFSAQIKTESLGGIPTRKKTTELTPENEYDFLLDFGILFRATIATQKFSPSSHEIQSKIIKCAHGLLNIDPKRFIIKTMAPIDFEMELLRYGLLERQPTPTSNLNNGHVFASFKPDFRVVFTSKFDKFLFWLDQNVGDIDPENAPLLQLAKSPRHA